MIRSQRAKRVQADMSDSVEREQNGYTVLHEIVSEGGVVHLLLGQGNR